MSISETGAGEEIRTLDPNLGKLEAAVFRQFTGVHEIRPDFARLQVSAARKWVGRNVKSGALE